MGIRKRSQDRSKAGDPDFALDALAAAGDVAYEWDLATDRMYWQGDIARFLGLDPKTKKTRGTSGRSGKNEADDVTARLSTASVYHNQITTEDLPIRLKALAEHYSRGGVFDCEYRIRSVTGTHIWVHDRGAAVETRAGRPSRVRGILRVVEQRKDHEAELEQLANFDELTGLYNRSRLRETLHQTISHAMHHDSEGGYLVIGIDKLSLINDGFGHASADAVIVAVGQRIKHLIKSGQDHIGRVGGDVFGVILTDCAQEYVADVADRLLEAFRDHSLETPFGPVHVTVSIGGICFPHSASTPIEAMTRAESALQSAKRAGRDRYEEYMMSEEQKAEHRLALSISEKVKTAIRKREAIFLYQPIVDSQSNEVIFYEALIRIRDDDGALMPASTFIPAVERLGLTHMVDHYTLIRSIEELIAREDLVLAINVSGFTVSDRSWLRACMELLRDKRDVAQRLIIEITETAAMQDLEESTRFVAAVHNLGCRVALDDFGAGYTSFRHLRALNADIVKIDGSFIRDLSENVDNQLFVRSLINIAQGFGLQTVAECVETAEDAALLGSKGVQLLQGWHFGKPQPLPQLIPVGQQQAAQ